MESIGTGLYNSALGLVVLVVVVVVFLLLLVVVMVMVWLGCLFV